MANRLLGAQLISRRRQGTETSRHASFELTSDQASSALRQVPDMPWNFSLDTSELGCSSRPGREEGVRRAARCASLRGKSARQKGEGLELVTSRWLQLFGSLDMLTFWTVFDFYP